MSRMFHILIFVSRNGYLHDKSQYMYFSIERDENHCLTVNPGKSPNWRKICGKGDKSCDDATDCNYIECSTWI